MGLTVTIDCVTWSDGFEAGDTIQLSYHVTVTGTPGDIGLGAGLYADDGTDFSGTGSDDIDRTYVGIGTTVISRPFRVPAGLPTDVYELVGEIWPPDQVGQDGVGTLATASCGFARPSAAAVPAATTAPTPAPTTAAPTTATTLAPAPSVPPTTSTPTATTLLGNAGPSGGTTAPPGTAAPSAVPTSGEPARPGGTTARGAPTSSGPAEGGGTRGDAPAGGTSSSAAEAASSTGPTVPAGITTTPAPGTGGASDEPSSALVKIAVLFIAGVLVLGAPLVWRLYEREKSRLQAAAPDDRTRLQQEREARRLNAVISVYATVLGAAIVGAAAVILRRVT